MPADSEILHEYPYRSAWWLATALILLACAGEALLVWLAFNIDGPANARGIELSNEQARMILGVIAALVPIGIVMLLINLLHPIFHPRRIAVARTGIILPKPSRSGMSAEEILIRYDDILAATVCKMSWSSGGFQWLVIQYGDGTVSVLSLMLPSRRMFHEIVAEISRHLAERGLEVREG